MMNGIEYAGGGSGGGGGGNVDDVYVNGTSVLDSDKIAQITSYKEVTYAEWEALPDTKYEDGIAYFIKDSTEAEGFPPLIYSNEERQIGVWIDGKPLYQKYISYDCENNTNLQNAYPFVNNEETVIILADWFISNVGQKIFNSVWYGNIMWTSSIIQGVSGYSDGIYVHKDTNNTEFGSGVKYKAIIQYTKTTDVAGGGIWAGNGATAHHYSSSETIIGTWTDGKPLYEKVVTFTASQAGYVDVNDLHISKMISCAGFVTQTNGNIVNLPYGAGNNDFAIPYYNTTNGRLYCSYSGSYNVAEWTVILQYTKTTD